MRQHNVVEFLCHVLLLITVTFITNTPLLCSHPVVAVLSVKGV